MQWCADDAEEPAAQQVPPKICFNLMKERDARKRLQDYGLSTVGEKQVRLLASTTAIWLVWHMCLVQSPQGRHQEPCMPAGSGKAVQRVSAVRTDSV
jgi:hypothetical protein